MIHVNVRGVQKVEPPRTCTWTCATLREITNSHGRKLKGRMSPNRVRQHHSAGCFRVRLKKGLKYKTTLRLLLRQQVAGILFDGKAKLVDPAVSVSAAAAVAVTAMICQEQMVFRCQISAQHSIPPARNPRAAFAQFHALGLPTSLRTPSLSQPTCTRGTTFASYC